MTKDAQKIRMKRDRENAAKRNKRREDPEYRAKEKNWRHRGAAHVTPGQQIRETSLLTNEQTGELDASWTKTHKEPGPPTTPPPNFLLDKLSVFTVAGEQRAHWAAYSPEKHRQWDTMFQAMKEATEEYRGIIAPVEAPTNCPPRLLNVLAIGDPHIGMYAWSKETGQAFDCDIAKRDLMAVAVRLLARTPPAETIIIANLGDLYHAEDDTLRTPRGNNPLDGDGRSGRVTKIGYLLLRALYDLALQKHQKIIGINLRGNHDPYKSVALNLYLQGIYERESRVQVLDNNDPFIFHEFGKNLLGFHHGDGAKPEQLGGIMATYRGGAPWGRTRHRRWFTGHLHSFNGRDLAGCTWESFRTLAPSDFWAHWRGYRSEQSLDCLTFDIEDGLESRQRVTLPLKDAA